MSTQLQQLVTSWHGIEPDVQGRNMANTTWISYTRQTLWTTATLSFWHNTDIRSPAWLSQIFSRLYLWHFFKGRLNFSHLSTLVSWSACCTLPFIQCLVFWSARPCHQQKWVGLTGPCLISRPKLWRILWWFWAHGMTPFIFVNGMVLLYMWSPASKLRWITPGIWETRGLCISIPCIGNLSSLWFLCLQDNSFNREIPSEIDRLYRLEKLYLHYNSFGGKISTNVSSPFLTWKTSSVFVITSWLGKSLPSFAPYQSFKCFMYKNKLTGNIPP